MRVYQLFDNVQTEAQAGHAFGIRAALELCEDSFLILKGNSNAMISYGEQSGVAYRPHLDHNWTAGSVFDGVGQKVCHNLFHSA
jgi:hypothetical protein